HGHVGRAEVDGVGAQAQDYLRSFRICRHTKGVLLTGGAATTVRYGDQYRLAADIAGLRRPGDPSQGVNGHAGWGCLQGESDWIVIRIDDEDVIAVSRPGRDRGHG